MGTSEAWGKMLGKAGLADLWSDTSVLILVVYRGLFVIYEVVRMVITLPWKPSRLFG